MEDAIPPLHLGPHWWRSAWHVPEKHCPLQGIFLASQSKPENLKLASILFDLDFLPADSFPPAAATGRRRYSPSGQQAAASASVAAPLRRALGWIDLYVLAHLLRSVLTSKYSTSWSCCTPRSCRRPSSPWAGVQPQMCDWIDCSVSWLDRQKRWKASFIISLVAGLAYEIHSPKHGLNPTTPPSLAYVGQQGNFIKQRVAEKMTMISQTRGVVQNILILTPCEISWTSPWFCSWFHQPMGNSRQVGMMTVSSEEASREVKLWSTCGRVAQQIPSAQKFTSWRTPEQIQTVSAYDTSCTPSHSLSNSKSTFWGENRCWIYRTLWGFWFLPPSFGSGLLTWDGWKKLLHHINWSCLAW